jgi:DNA-binding NtrC family response regulator
VLVVDDDPRVGTAIGRVLKAFRVTFVQSATGALGRIDAGAVFGAIVCDLVMPGLSGFQFYAELERMDPELARRVVFLSGFAKTPEVEAFIRRVGARCLLKPFQSQELRTAVEEATRRAHLQVESKERSSPGAAGGPRLVSPPAPTRIGGADGPGDG